MNVAVVSLCPLDQRGGSATFTLNSIQAVRSAGDFCDGFAVRSDQPSARFHHSFDFETGPLSAGELLRILSSFDVVWIQQYLASPLIFDIADSIRPEQTLFLTDLGCSRILEVFRARYRPARNHWFVEPSAELAERSRRFSPQAVEASAGIWLDVLGSHRGPRFSWPRRSICVTSSLAAAVISLAPPGFEVFVTGGPSLGPDGLYYLEGLADLRGVRFRGEVPESARRDALRFAGGLAAGEEEMCWTSSRDNCAVLNALTQYALPIICGAGGSAGLMRRLGLRDFVVDPNDWSGLALALERLDGMTPAERAVRIEEARARLRAAWLWDDYWERVATATGLCRAPGALFAARAAERPRGHFPVALDASSAA